MGVIDCSLNPLTLRLSAGTSPAFTLAALSGPVAFAPSTATELRFEVKVSFPPAPVRAQPSGTFTEKPALGTLKRTNCVLSGMSPGGAVSFAFGLTACLLVLFEVALLDEELLLDPQAPIASAAMTPAAQMATGRFMAATVVCARRARVTRRSTPGQNHGRRARARVASAAWLLGSLSWRM